MLELVVQNENPSPCLVSMSLDTIRMNAEFMRLMIFHMSAMDSAKITDEDWKKCMESMTTLCSAVETLANLNGGE